MISVVIRTQNEESWIGRCLAAVTAQNYPDFEIIIVDNESTDGTLAIVEQFNCRLVHIRNEDFTFGRSLNWGIKDAQGEYIAILSGHCIPVNERWLSSLHASLNEGTIAGVYGRQLPLPDTTPYDKRDLWTTFGIERRVQTKDIFFHNANSIIRRSIWETTPFDEEIQGVEDRDWAQRVLAQGYHVAYEPTAAVYHYHGIHHGRDARRSARVARVIELINDRAGLSRAMSGNLTGNTSNGS